MPALLTNTEAICLNKKRNMLDKEITDQFNIHQIKSIKPLSTGLINNSFAIESENGENVLLQQINTSIFLKPEDIQSNYQHIFDHFNRIGSYQLPKIIQTQDSKNLLYQQGTVWRCFEYFRNTYSPLIADTPEEAYTVAKCFGRFSADLSSIDIRQLQYILPGFHNLDMRFQQFETAIQNASKQRKVEAESLIQSANDNYPYVQWYQKISQNKEDYPLHILHQDCKIANILFWKDDASRLCPIDLDTTQPGLFFSDFGDMIRSMVPNISENDNNIEDMQLRVAFYDAIKKGYLEAMNDHLTPAEKEDIDLSGNIIIYMQALRFLTDFLNGDVYYKTEYPLQNKNRAANQFRLLELLQMHQKKSIKVSIED
ncbi:MULTISPECIES: phosphotransferase enzyme family protein [Chitinophagaceae]